MGSISYQIGFSGSVQLAAANAITKEVLPKLNQAVRAVAQATAADWQREVHKAKLWSGEKDAYAQSITVKMTSDFSAVVSASYKHAAEIETGRPTRDLKKMLDTSLKVRLTKGGKRFLVIPFRHNTPGNNALGQAMPAGAYAMAKAMAASKVVSTTQRPSGEVTYLSPKTGMHAAPQAQQRGYLSNTGTKQAQMVAKRNYAWGGRLTTGALKAAGMSHHGAV